MGFWSKVGQIAGKVVSGFKKAAKVLVESISSGVKEVLGGYNKKSPTFEPLKPVVKKPTDEEERKAHLREHMRVLARYQEQVEKEAMSKETKVQKAYDRAYRDILVNLQQYDIDVSDIKRYMNKKRASFANSMRDEVNTKVSPEYRSWRILMEDVNVSDAKIRAYTDSVYEDAKNNLLDLLANALEETNNYIKQNVDKYIEDKSKALQIQKESLVNMTKDKDSKMKELQKIMEEYAIMAFIQHEAKKEI